ncbi:MAG: cobalamin biosynthesis protein CbiM, partial [Methanomicrobiales archaeon HGW-Methanomicrobiales-4]
SGHLIEGALVSIILSSSCAPFYILTPVLIDQVFRFSVSGITVMGTNFLNKGVI